MFLKLYYFYRRTVILSQNTPNTAYFRLALFYVFYDGLVDELAALGNKKPLRGFLLHSKNYNLWGGGNLNIS